MNPSPKVLALLREAEQHMLKNDAASAERALLAARLQAPTAWPVLHAEVNFNRRVGRLEAAQRTLDQALALAPDLSEVWVAAGALAADRADMVSALAMLNTASNKAQEFSALLTLALELDRLGLNEQLLEVAARALKRKPAQVTALLLHTRAAQALGLVAQAADNYRALIKRREHLGKSWFGLLDLKTVSISSAELQTLRLHAADPRLSSAERTLLGFALGRALEMHGNHPEAFKALLAANALVPSRWHAGEFAAEVKGITDALAQAGPHADGLGREVIFLVGLPRSGTTLVEQVLASHPAVEGASELSTLSDVITAESASRKRTLAQWAGQASAADWQRLGEAYLRKTARWRQSKPIATDKLPENWLLAGAALKMLPQARVIDVRRDPVETCWSCFKQLFAPGRVEFSYSLEHLAAYWRIYEQASQRWAAAFPQRYRIQSYEAMLADPEAEIRALLAFCDLQFDPACLAPHLTQRSVRSASAAQVRLPIQRSTARTHGYAELLKPFRAQLQNF